MVTVFQSSLYNMGQLIYEIKSVVKDVFLINTIFKTIYTTFPNYDFSDLTTVQKAVQQFNACNVNAATSVSASICLVEPTQADISQQADYYRYFIGSFLQMDDYMSSLYKNAYYDAKIFRVIIQTYSEDTPTILKKRNIFKIYPASYIDDTESYYNIITKYYSDQKKIYLNDPTKQKIFIQGPYNIYMPSTSETVPVISLSTTFNANLDVPTSPTTNEKENIFFHVRVEVLMSEIDRFVKSHSFRSKNEIIILNKNGTFVYLSEYWKVKQSSTYVFDASMQNYSGLDETTFQNLITEQKQIVVNKLNKDGNLKDYLITPVLLNNTYDANNIQEYLQSGVFSVQNDNYFVVLLYGERDQMYEVSDKIRLLSEKQESITIRICAITSFITIVIVYVATYLVSVKVDRPLRVIINILKKLNNSGTIKETTLVQIKDQLEYQEAITEFQVKDLVKTYKSLIETLINRSNAKNNLIKPTIDYPLNELEMNFVKKTKGNKAQFDWEVLINQIKNQSNFGAKQKAIQEKKQKK